MDQTRTFLPLPPDIAGSDELRPLVERANGWLDEQIPEWPNPLTVEWYQYKPDEREGYVGVRFTDRYAHSLGLFPKTVLTDRDTFRTRMYPVLLSLTDNALRTLNRTPDELGDETTTDVEAA
jgi:hypothetical protein